MVESKHMERGLRSRLSLVFDEESDMELKAHIRKLIIEIIEEEFKGVKFVPISYPTYEPKITCYSSGKVYAPASKE